MRTIKELEQAALTLRARLLDEGKNPLEATFTVTHDERYLIHMEPFLSPTVSHLQDRFCGMKLLTV